MARTPHLFRRICSHNAVLRAAACCCARYAASKDASFARFSFITSRNHLVTLQPDFRGAGTAQENCCNTCRQTRHVAPDQTQQHYATMISTPFHPLEGIGIRIVTFFERCGISQPTVINFSCGTGSPLQTNDTTLKNARWLQQLRAAWKPSLVANCLHHLTSG